MDNKNTRIESKLEVKSYLQNFKYALDNGAKLIFQEDRLIDKHRDIRYTNRYTIADLFPNEDPIKVLKRELKTLTVEDYMVTLKDKRFVNRKEMREFGKVYNSN